MLSRAPYYVALGLSLFALSEAHADGMRCGTKLVGNGDSMYTVESRCGSPDDKQHRTETRTERVWINLPCPVRGQVGCGQMVERTVEVTIDEWTYDFGPEKLIQRAIFQQGQLVNVISGSYGTKRE
jgi:Protein of unknown function (DUF2845)